MSRLGNWLVIPSSAAVSAPAILAILLFGMAAGCSSNPWHYNTPPSALGVGPASGVDPKVMQIVVVGDFRNPDATPLKWKDIGSGVSTALSQALLNEGNFDVWTNEPLAIAVERVLQGPSPERAGRLDELHDKHPEVRFVITGQVTDFHHTDEVSRDVRRRALFGSKKEAIAAVRFTVVDLHLRRVVLADHVYGTAPVGRQGTESVYGDIAFGSYLFWNSPLGRATEGAIRMAMERITTTMPAVAVAGAKQATPGPPQQVEPASQPEPIRIAELLTTRRVRLTGGRAAGLVPGQELYICHGGGAGGALEPIMDPQTRLPLKVRIAEVEDRRAVALVTGRAPNGADLIASELRAHLPVAAAPLAAAGAASAEPDQAATSPNRD